YAGSRLKPANAWEGAALLPAFQPYRGKPAVRNDREGRGNVGIIRSPNRASTLPDCGGRSAMSVPTATWLLQTDCCICSRPVMAQLGLKQMRGMSAAGES